MAEKGFENSELENFQSEQLALMESAVDYLGGIQSDLEPIRKMADIINFFLEREMANNGLTIEGIVGITSVDDEEWMNRNRVIVDDDFLRIEMLNRKKGRTGSSYFLRVENKSEAALRYSLSEWSINRRNMEQEWTRGEIPAGHYRIDQWMFPTFEEEELSNIEGKIEVETGETPSKVLWAYDFTADANGDISVSSDAKFEAEKQWHSRNSIVLDDDFARIEIVGRERPRYSTATYVVRVENKSEASFCYDVENFIVNKRRDTPYISGVEIPSGDYRIEEWRFEIDDVDRLVNIDGELLFKEPKRKYAYRDELRRYRFTADENGDIAITLIGGEEVFEFEDIEDAPGAME